MSALLRRHPFKVSNFHLNQLWTTISTRVSHWRWPFRPIFSDKLLHVQCIPYASAYLINAFQIYSWLIYGTEEASYLIKWPLPFIECSANYVRTSKNNSREKDWWTLINKSQWDNVSMITKNYDVTCLFSVKPKCAILRPTRSTSTTRPTDTSEGAYHLLSCAKL